MKKVLLDTNFILRYSLKDIESQYIQAQKTFKEIESGITRAYLSLLVINEFSWINEKYYKVPRTIYVSWLIKFVLLNKVEIVEVRNHPFMIGCQFHPEFLAHPLSPHPLFTAFVKACIGKQKK